MKTSKHYDRLLLYLLISFVVFLLAVLSAAHWLSPAYYYTLFLSLLFAAAAIKIRHTGHQLAIREGLCARWGKAQSRDRDFTDLEKKFRAFPVDGDKERVISAQTKEDLHIELLYGLLDRTFTTPGAQVLYNMMKKPQLTGEKLAGRGAVIRLLDKNPVLREKMMVRLQQLDRQKTDTVTTLIWDEELVPARLGFMPTVLACISLLAVAAVFIFGIKGFLCGVMPMFAVNLYYKNNKEKELDFHLPAFHYLRSMITAASDLAQITADEIHSYSRPLQDSAHACKDYVQKTMLLGLKNIDSLGLYEYLNTLFLTDMRNYEKAVEIIVRKREEMKKIYQLTGELDALLAVSSLRAGQLTWVEPKLVHKQFGIACEKVYHPLLDDPVANSITLQKPGVVLTGSNMSGKSTFLRTIGVNALLAQTIFTCFAKSYKANYFSIVTSINKDDYLPGGKSFFLAEAEAILAMIEDSSDQVTSLCIIDEIFRGTHSLERIPAAIEVLRYLAKQNTLSIVATHDMDVAKACSDIYLLYHFSERVGEAGLAFDYLLKPGLTKTWNAIRILEYLGFPQDIVKQAAASVNKKQ